MKLRQNNREVAVIPVDGACKFTWKRLRIDVWIHVEMNNF